MPTPIVQFAPLSIPRLATRRTAPTEATIRKRIGLLEHHADAAANLHGGSAIVDIHVANPHSAGGTRFRHRLMHAVEAAHECGFSAARRTDHSGGVIGRNRHVDVLQSLSLTEPGVQLVDLDAHTHSSVRSLKHTPIGHQAYRTDRSDNSETDWPSGTPCRCGGESARRKCHCRHPCRQSALCRWHALPAPSHACG